MPDRKEILNKIMNRLRARLYNNLESAGLNDVQLEACKKAVKDITSSAWNDLNNLLNDINEN